MQSCRFSTARNWLSWRMFARGVVYLLAISALGCRLGSPLVLNADEPQHACASSGVSACGDACTRDDDGQACLVASLAYGDGRGVPMNHAMNHAYEKEACELGVAQGCGYYANNFSSESSEDLRIANEYHERGCTGGWARSCVTLGSMALRIDASGKPTSPRVALKRYDEACTRGDSLGCSSAGDLHTLGLGTEPNPAVAKDLYQQACEGGRINVCHNAEDDAELWLSIPTDTLFDVAHTFFRPANAPPGWSVPVVARLCLTRDSPEPKRVEITTSPNEPKLDALFVEMFESWRFHARPWLTSNKTFCIMANYTFYTFHTPSYLN
jgi:hypothetical protein